MVGLMAYAEWDSVAATSINENYYTNASVGVNGWVNASGYIYCLVGPDATIIVNGTDGVSTTTDPSVQFYMYDYPVISGISTGPLAYAVTGASQTTIPTGCTQRVWSHDGFWAMKVEGPIPGYNTYGSDKSFMFIDEVEFFGSPTDHGEPNDDVRRWICGSTGGRNGNLQPGTVNSLRADTVSDPFTYAQHTTGWRLGSRFILSRDEKGFQRANFLDHSSASSEPMHPIIVSHPNNGIIGHLKNIRYGSSTADFAGDNPTGNNYHWRDAAYTGMLVDDTDGSLWHAVAASQIMNNFTYESIFGLVTRSDNMTIQGYPEMMGGPNIYVRADG